MPDRNKVIEAFERCFCEKHSSCPGCYQDGPGFGMECRKAVLLDVLALLKDQEKTIEQLEYNLSITEHNINYYVNGND